MDGSFACPECGNTVEVHGLSPGRQTRCEFCSRLVEIPFIPRVVDPTWKRARFGRPRWVTWAWVALGLSLVVIISIGSSRLFVRRASREKALAIEKLLSSSAQHRKMGAYGPALVDLDAAIELAHSSSSMNSERLVELKQERAKTVHQEVEGILTKLSRSEGPASASSTGEWLSLRARASKDPDLSSLKFKIEEKFQFFLSQRVESAFQAARQEFQAGRYSESLESCIRMDRDAAQLPPDVGDKWRIHAQAFVASLIRNRGVLIEPLSGQFIHVSDQTTYESRFIPVVKDALRSNGYLLQPVGIPMWNRPRLPLVTKSNGYLLQPV